MFSELISIFGIVSMESLIHAAAVLLFIALLLVCFQLYLALLKAKAAQKELTIANQTMEAGVKAKGEFLVNMSHTIRTPMSALTSFTEILTQRVANNSNTEFKEEIEGILDIIKKNSRDLLDTINDVLDYVKIDANMLEIETVPMSLKQVIHNVCLDEKPNVIAKHLDLSIKYIGDIPPLVLSDPVRIEQILAHLISNAVKFTEKGTITILCEALTSVDPEVTIVVNSPTASADTESADAESTFSASLASLKISVIDTGTGLSPTQIQDIFKPFKPLDSSPTYNQGSKLGLSIAMRLAKLLDGTINVESTPGQGSTFSLLLNVYVPQGNTMMAFDQIEGQQRGSQLLSGLDIRMPQRSRVALPDENQPLQRARILVVEDMIVNQVIIATLLRYAGAQVEIADNGAIGVQKVMQDKDNGLVFDVILMDMQMPVMNGYEATTFLRKHGYDRPIVAVTAYALAGDRAKTLAAGCNDYIAKPIENKTLIAMIQKYVD